MLIAMELCNYIQNELAGLMKQVQATPPKRYTSLKRIKAMISSVPLERPLQRAISQSIKKVQSVLKEYSTPKKKMSKPALSQPSHLQIEFESEKQAIKQLLNTKIQSRKTERQSIQQLQQRYLEVKQQRQDLQQHLQQLVAKVQKLERLKLSRQKYHDKERAKSAVDRELQKRIEKIKAINGDLSESLKLH